MQNRHRYIAQRSNSVQPVQELPNSSRLSGVFSTYERNAAADGKGLQNTGQAISLVLLGSAAVLALLLAVAFCYKKVPFLARELIPASRSSHRRTTSIPASFVPQHGEPDFVIVTASSLAAEKLPDMSVISVSRIETKNSCSSLSSWEQDLFYDETVASTRHFHVEFGAIQEEASICSHSCVHSPAKSVASEVPVPLKMFRR